ncbi:thiamine phosphate synthase [Sandaracinobacter neustonicus]|uniref:Thiamine phosphate synthase n=1 Tax=Sandaracinobacter neustonicus TaxID=1715348 RepID=A0A501XMF2_9SPHN|nr:thiamine phosphate synthase [Sandaracinobacter neustonicus]TPE61828.1 thiamine phosphate synthase [Sandaracinobacter neustonicus]
MRRARVPTLWLFTDERLGGLHPDDPLWAALDRLPRGSGIVFRHYGWPATERRALFAALQAHARRRHLTLIGSETAPTPGGRHLPAHARHRHRHRHPQSRGLLTAAAHNRRELLQGFRSGADLIFLSPAFPTTSHPGAPALGPARFGLMARNAPGPVIALGGMTASRARRLKPLGAAGFAGIDCWVMR